MHALRLPYKAIMLAFSLVAVLAVSACTLVDRVGEPRVEVEGGDAMVGRDLVQQNGCIACHTIPGIAGADAHVGPPLDSWSDRAYIAGREPNEPETLVYFLMDPKSVDERSAMPVVGLTEEEARDIAAFLYTLDD